MVEMSLSMRLSLIRCLETCIYSEGFYFVLHFFSSTQTFTHFSYFLLSSSIPQNRSTMAGIMSSFLAILSILCHTASAYFCFQCGNCPDDDNTFCEIGSDTPVCLPGSANFGKCTSQVTTTATRTWVIETATSMRYTSSVDNYETVSSLVSVAAANKVTSTETETSTVVS
jgi:hypothetical protein